MSRKRSWASFCMLSRRTSTTDDVAAHAAERALHGHPQPLVRGVDVPHQRVLRLFGLPAQAIEHGREVLACALVARGVQASEAGHDGRAHGLDRGEVVGGDRAASGSRPRAVAGRRRRGGTRQRRQRTARRRRARPAADDFTARLQRESCRGGGGLVSGARHAGRDRTARTRYRRAACCRWQSKQALARKRRGRWPCEPSPKLKYAQPVRAAAESLTAASTATRRPSKSPCRLGATFVRRLVQLQDENGAIGNWPVRRNAS